MIDIHCHIIPGIDDGAGNAHDATEMARLAAASGIRAMIATPHCHIPGVCANYWSDAMENRFRQIRQELSRREIPVALYPGQEVFMSGPVTELLRQGKLITLNRSRYLLVEFDPEESASLACRKLAQVAAEGYVPIVAHPERYGFVSEQPETVYKMKEMGALLQINKGSLKGRFGIHAMRTADRLLSRRQADFVASDAHSQYSRTPWLADAHELLCERYSADYARLLLSTNPKKVIADERILSG